MSSDQPQNPPSLLSRLPGDAYAEPTLSPSPSPPPPASTPSSSSAPTDKPADTLILTSISPTDPTKRRDFEARYYLPSSASSAHSLASRSFLDLPESYFQPTPVELQQAYAGQVKRREDLTDRPLLTKRLRDRQEAEKSRAKAARWPQTRIRIRFADRSQLEGVFPSTDKLVHLYEFVRLALREDVRDKVWYLYQSPPRTEYRKGDPKWRGKTLMDLEFTPSSALYIKFEDEADAGLNDASSPPPLLPSLLSAGGPLPAPPSFTNPSSDPSSSSGAGVEKTPQQLKKEKEDKLKRLMGKGLGLGGNKGMVKPGWMKGGKDAHKK
ncbi:hypothetical protein JCM8097_008402 [Rhodosporidiobolus ruineniae]